MLYNMWKRYESLSAKTGSAAEFVETGSETPTKDNPRFLMYSRIPPSYGILRTRADFTQGE